MLLIWTDVYGVKYHNQGWMKIWKYEKCTWDIKIFAYLLRPITWIWLTIHGVQIADARNEYDYTWRKCLPNLYTHIYHEIAHDFLILCYHPNQNLFVYCLPILALEIDCWVVFEMNLMRKIRLRCRYMGIFP